jgi:hypothetical protein
MKKQSLAITAAAAVIVSGLGFAAPAQATRGDWQDCVTNREFKAIEQGMLKKQTQRILDGEGERVTKRVRAYEVCGEPGQEVRVKFKKKYSKGWNRVVAKRIVGEPQGPSIEYLWEQDFDTNTNGWSDSTNGWHGSIERSNGRAIVNGDADSAPFSNFGGYTEDWPGAWTAELDVYLDPAWNDGEGFDYSVAATGTDGKHQRDYIFHVTKDTSQGALLVGGSNNTNFETREDLETGNHYTVTKAGWYTLQHSFYEKDGSLVVDLNLLDSDGNVVFTETRAAGADDTMDQIGGNRYSWFTHASVTDLAVDNHQLFITPSAS